MLGIIDYGVGNLFSLRSSLKAIGVESIVTSDPEEILRADRLILPGVGAYSDAMKKLKDSGTVGPIMEAAAAGTPLMGICLGMQLLLEKSYEYGEHEGLGMIPGSVRPIADDIPESLKVPHIGWNGLAFGGQKHDLFRDVEEGEYVYFVHSFYATDCDEAVIATTDYGAVLTAAVAKGNVLGCQFHPEKSGDVGLRILKRFCEM